MISCVCCDCKRYYLIFKCLPSRNAFAFILHPPTRFGFCVGYLSRRPHLCRVFFLFFFYLPIQKLNTTKTHTFGIELTHIMLEIGLQIPSVSLCICMCVCVCVCCVPFTKAKEYILFHCNCGGDGKTRAGLERKAKLK